MKKLFSLCILALSLFLCSGAKNAAVINFNNTAYSIAFSTKGASGGYFNEYVKNKQTVHDWNELIVIHSFPKASSPIDEAKKIAGAVTSIYKKQSPDNKAPVAVSYNKNDDSAIVDFILPVPNKDNNQLKCLEFNAFKYQKASNNKGLIAFQYSKRFYPNEIKQEKLFQANLIKTRKTILPAIADVKIPSIIEKDIK